MRLSCASLAVARRRALSPVSRTGVVARATRRCFYVSMTMSSVFLVVCYLHKNSLTCCLGPSRAIRPFARRVQVRDPTFPADTLVRPCRSAVYA